MPAGLASAFKVYPEQLQSGIVETLTQNTAAFNADSRGAINLTTVSRRGDFSQQAFFKAISGLVSRRDTTSGAPATDLTVAQDEFVSVKLNRKIGPVNQTRDAFRKIQQGRTDQELSFIIGQQVGIGMAAEMLNSVVRGLGAALGAQSSVVSGDGTATMDTAALVSMLAKFGDAAGRIVAWVMHSKVYYDLVQSQITDKVTGVAGLVVANATPITLNRPVIVTDSDALLNASVYTTLGLVSGAALAENTEQEDIVVQDVTGNENLSVRWQGEYAYNLGLAGFKWDVTAGANPNDTALGTGANWKTTRQSFKDFAGVVGLTK